MWWVFMNVVLWIREEKVESSGRPRRFWGIWLELSEGKMMSREGPLVTS